MLIGLPSVALTGRAQSGATALCSTPIGGKTWRHLLADVPTKTLAELSDALCVIIQPYSFATLQSLTSFAYFVQEVETAQQALYG